jgi:hypothetical protein
MYYRMTDHLRCKTSGEAAARLRAANVDDLMALEVAAEMAAGDELFWEPEVAYPWAIIWAYEKCALIIRRMGARGAFEPDAPDPLLPEVVGATIYFGIGQSRVAITYYSLILTGRGW